MKPLHITLKTLLVVVGIGLSMGAMAATYTMKISTAAGPGDPRNIGANKVAQVLNNQHVCSIHAHVYPSSQLGGSNSIIQLLQTGAVEANIEPGSFLQGFAPLMGLMDIPYLWPLNTKQLLKLHDTPAVQQMLASTKSAGIVSLGIWFVGYKNWTGPRPMVKPSDFKGLVARVMPSKILVEQNKLLGLQNVSMDFGDVYTALQNGTVAAEDNPITTITSMRFYEVQKYMTMTKHGTLGQVFMVSKKWWDKLPATCHTEIRKAVKIGGQADFNATEKQITADLKKFKGYMKVIPMTRAQRMVLARVVYPDRAYFVKLTGKRGEHLLHELYKAIAKIKGVPVSKVAEGKTL